MLFMGKSTINGHLSQLFPGHFLLVHQRVAMRSLIRKPLSSVPAQLPLLLFHMNLAVEAMEAMEAMAPIEIDGLPFLKIYLKMGG